MPQLDIFTFFSQLVYFLFAFTLLYNVLSFYILPSFFLSLFLRLWISSNVRTESCIFLYYNFISSQRKKIFFFNIFSFFSVHLLIFLGKVSFFFLLFFVSKKTIQIWFINYLNFFSVLEKFYVNFQPPQIYSENS